MDARSNGEGCHRPLDFCSSSFAHHLYTVWKVSEPGALKQRNARRFFDSFTAVVLTNYLLTNYDATEHIPVPKRDRGVSTPRLTT